MDNLGLTPKMPEGFCKDYVRKPWGYYVDALRTPNHVLKTLVLDPGKAISIQKHEHRSEYWTIVHGNALVSSGDTPEEMRGVSYASGAQIVIIPTEWHTVSNLSSTEPLVIAEVQLGDRCEEEDIQRAQGDTED